MILVLKDLLPENKFEYYRYQGSLTTPPCNEIVIWTIFKQPIEVSQKQIDIMRKAYYRVEGEKGHRDISNNYRAPQPLNGREVEEISTSIQFRSPILSTIDASGSNGNQRVIVTSRSPTGRLDGTYFTNIIKNKM